MDVIQGMRTFAAVAQSGSFSAGAKRLGLSRALASKYVGQLEDRLGLRLLNRSTRSVALTACGRAYLERCLRLLADFDDIESEARNARRTPRGPLRISAPTAFGELFLTRILAGFTARYPETAVSLSLSDRYVNLVEEGFDVAVRIGALKDSSLIARQLTSMGLLVCAAPAHVRRHGAPAHPFELKTHPCVLDENLRDGDRWPFVIEGVRHPVAVSGRLRVNSARAVRDLLLAGEGIGLCPSFLVEEDIRSGRLLRLLTGFQPPEYGVYALFPHSRRMAVSVRALIDFLVENFEASQPESLPGGGHGRPLLP